MNNFINNPYGLKQGDLVIITRKIWGEHEDRLCYIFTSGENERGHFKVQVCGAYGVDISVGFDSFDGIRPATDEEVRLRKRVYLAKDFIGQIALYEGTKAVAVTDRGDGFVNAVFVNSADYTSLKYDSRSLTHYTPEPLIDVQLKYIEENIQRCEEALETWKEKKTLFLEHKAKLLEKNL